MADYPQYAAFGLKVRSPIPLNEFVLNGAGGGEVTVEFGPEPEWIAEIRGDHNYLRVRRDETRFWFKGVAGFVVKDGSQIVVIPEAGCDQSGLRLFIEGMMMATILYQRGLCVLHASVVEINGCAVAFLGEVGAGKSSLAAALYARGHRVVTDDNAAIELTTGTPTVLPAYPSVKLFPAIASSLGFRNGHVSVLHSSLPKVAGAVAERFTYGSLPLRQIYLLGRAYDSELVRIPPMQAAMELIRYSVPTRWGHPGDARQLEQCACIARQLPIYTLRTFTDLSSLPVLAESVESHVAAVPNDS